MLKNVLKTAAATATLSLGLGLIAATPALALDSMKILVPANPGGGWDQTARALQAAMQGYEVKTMEDVVSTADIFVTTTGNFNIITAEHMSKMKDKAIVSNIGHFDNEIDMAGLAKVKGIKKINIKPQYDEWVFPDGHSVMVLAEGRLMNLGCATGHPSFVMSASFTNQTLAQLELHANAEKYGKTVTMLPKKLDEEVARLHLDHIGVKLTKLTPQQAEYLGVPVDGPYKPEHYRY